jgi:hypothetical protein
MNSNPKMANISLVQAYPVIGITHKEGFTYCPLTERCFTRGARLLNAELRATRAGQHVLRLFAEKGGRIGKNKNLMAMMRSHTNVIMYF